MSNMNKPDRDKMLEEILSSVGSVKDNSRAARAAASSANRAASEKQTTVSPYQRVKNSSSDSVYGNVTNAKKNAYANKSSNISRKPSEYTGSINKAAYDERTDSMNRVPDDSRTGSINRMPNDGRTGSMSKMANDGRTGSMSRMANDGRTGSMGRMANDGRTGNISRNSSPDNSSSNQEYDNSRTGKVKTDDPLDIVERVSAVRTANAASPEAPSATRNRRKKKNRFSTRLPMILIVTTIIFTIAISLSILIISVGRDMLAIGKSDEIKIVTIPEGSTTEDVAQILYEEGIIKMPKAFVFVSKLGKMDTKYIAGEHELSPSNAYETIIDELTTDKSLEKATVNITFVEGCNLIEAGKQLQEAGVCDAERFVFYFNAGDYGYEFENHLPVSTTSKFNRMEGYLFPDTYTFYVDTDPEVVCQKIYKNFDEKFKPEYYKQMEKMNMTLDEVITLASIVQKESGSIKVMKTIASVFENRLANPQKFPKLQSDPTTYYVDEVIKPNIEIPSNAIFEAYDTYKCNGLPPGAISNPGTDAIEAVLFPDKTKYYFFYADIDTGETFFAETDEEHEHNKAMVNGELSDEDDEDDDEDNYDEDNDEDYDY